GNCQRSVPGSVESRDRESRALRSAREIPHLPVHARAQLLHRSLPAHEVTPRRHEHRRRRRGRPADRRRRAPGIRAGARRELAALPRGARDAAAGAVRRLSTPRGVGPVPRGDRACHRGGHRDRQEPPALRGRKTQGGHGSRGRRVVTEHDDEFDDFLARRRKLFRRPEQDVLEPPHEVDRLVLRQAREAIETRGEPREIRGMAWGAPLALAASLLVAFTIFLNVGLTKKERVPEVTVDQVALRRDYPPATVVTAPMAGTAVREYRSDASPGAPRNPRRKQASRDRRRNGATTPERGSQRSSGCVPRARARRPTPSWRNSSANTRPTPSPQTGRSATIRFQPAPGGSC